MNTLAERLQFARKQAGLSQTEVAKSLHVSASAVNQWEQGLSKNIKLEHFFSLARLLGQDPQWLATGTVFPSKRRRPAPPNGQPVAALNAEEKALLHHFRQLPARLRRQLNNVFRSLSGLASETGGLPAKRPQGGAD